MGFAPDERVRYYHGAAVEQILAATGEAAALGVGEEHVPTVVFDWEKIEADVILIIPVDYSNARPAPALGGLEQFAADTRVGSETTAPDELLLFILES